VRSYPLERKCRELCSISEHAEKLDFPSPFPVPNAPTKGERTLIGGDELQSSIASKSHAQVKLVGVQPEHADCAAVAVEIKPPNVSVSYEQRCDVTGVTPRRRWHLVCGSSMLMATGVWLIFGGEGDRGLLIAGVATCAVALMLLLATLAPFCRAHCWSHTCSTMISRSTSPSHTKSEASSPLSSTPSPRPSQHDNNWHSIIFRQWRSSSSEAPDQDESSAARKPRISPSRVSPTPPYEDAARQPPVLGRGTPRRGVAVAPKQWRLSLHQVYLYKPASIRPQRAQGGGDDSGGQQISAAALSRESRKWDQAQAAGWKLGRSREDDGQEDAGEQVTVVSPCKRARTEESTSVEGSMPSLA
jgi:hypothetical protein